MIIGKSSLSDINRGFSIKGEQVVSKFDKLNLNTRKTPRTLAGSGFSHNLFEGF